ncbi:MAG: biopolymer transporter ExbD [Burkholderiaceae bacterium]|jgi:biopolymer transport protein TolR
MSRTSSLRGGRSRKFKAEINVVPYIDVMLVLLVIFMVVAPITNPNVINLPTAGRSTLPPVEYIEIALKPKSAASIGIHGKKINTSKDRADLAGQLEQLHKKHPDLPLMISADKEIKYDEVVQSIAQAKKIGISRVGLATK